MINLSDIVFEDPQLLVINKPAGIMVEKDKYNHESIETMAEVYFKEKKYSQNTIVGITHRIDRPVSGVLLIAKKKSALKYMNALFSNKEINKTYYAIVENKPEHDKATLVHYLIKDAAAKKSIVYDKKTSRATRCELRYTVEEKIKNTYVLKIHPITGKHHQIRAQLSFIGCPIIGDIKYGSKMHYKTDAIYLHAFSAEFAHPVSLEKVCFKAELPEDWPYQISK